jgi:hypothetical protein
MYGLTVFSTILVFVISVLAGLHPRSLSRGVAAAALGPQALLSARGVPFPLVQSALDDRSGSETAI